jgi:methanogenic corrinoid protein MtbC1
VDLEPILAALDRYDGRSVDRQLGRLAAVLGPRQLVQEVVLPLMRRVGDAWQAGALAVAQEHLATASLRSLLGALVRLQSWREPAATVLFATPPGERHELGILAAAMLAAGGGLGALYLGPDVPIADIAQAARRGAAEAVVLGVTGAGGEAEALAAVHALAGDLPRGVKLLAGGARSGALAARLREAGATPLADFSELEAALGRMGARL